MPFNVRLRSLVPGLVWAVLVVLWVQGIATTRAVSAQEAEPLTTVILVRHAEKVVAEGVGDPPLVAAGAERARSLAYILGSLQVDAIYSTDRIRTRSTAAPLAAKLGLEVKETKYSQTYAADMAERIRQHHQGKVVVVVGHSNTTPDVARALGAQGVPDIPETDYDNLFIVTFSKKAAPRFLNLRF